MNNALLDETTSNDSRMQPDQMDETPGAAVDVESPNINNIEDNIQEDLRTEENVETHEDEAAMELETHSTGVSGKIEISGKIQAPSLTARTDGLAG